jgi:signal peptidase
VSRLLGPLRFLLWAAASAAGTLVLALAVSVAFGDRPFTVLSGSMEPVIHTGDVVISSPIAAVEARPGDIVTFRDPSDSRRLITHRLRSMELRGGSVRAVTKGDANNTAERWSVPAGATVGRVVVRVPRAGYALAAVRGPWGKLLLVVVPAVLLGALELVRIWRPRREEVSPDAAAA